MLEQRLTQALHAARPEPPEGFDRRSDAQLLRLRTKEDKQVKKVSGLVIALALVLALGMTAAVAAGVIRWQSGLEDSLQITGETKAYFSNTALFDTPNLSVTDQGVTVTLEQCVVDEHAAYIAFRVSGYTPPEGKQPAFQRASCSAGLTTGEASSGSFYNGLNIGQDGRAVYVDGSPVDWSQPLPYAAENGDLMYIISMTAEEEAYPGRYMEATFSGLGVYENKWGDVQVDVPGIWHFRWQLKGSNATRELDGLCIPVGKNGATLQYVKLSPLSIEMKMNVPRYQFQPGEDTEDDYLEYSNAPYFMGVRMKNGQVYLYINGAGMDGYVSKNSDLFTSTWSLNQVIIPDEVEALLFSMPNDGSDELYAAPLEE